MVNNQAVKIPYIESYDSRSLYAAFASF